MGSKSGSVVVGYEYYAGMHMLACHGPVDRLNRIIVGDRVAWEGSQTTSGEITIDKPELFGGNSREGGIKGKVDVEFGAATQGRNSYLTSMLGATVPAFRGLVGLVLKQVMVSAINPYIKPWKPELTRFPNPGWYAEKRAIGTLDANAAHIIVECLTNAEWGMGYTLADIDDASFTAFADTIYSEGFGLSILWDQQSKVQDFIQQVLQHVEGAIYVDPATGLFTAKLIRADYNKNTLASFGPDEIISVEQFQRSQPGDSANTVTIRWVDRDGKAQATTVHDIAGIEATGQEVATTIDMPGIPTADIAMRVAVRTLGQLARPVAKMTAILTRAAGNVRIGQPILITSAEHAMAGAVMRVTGIGYGTLRDGRVRLDMIEDAFSLPAYTATGSQAGLWTSPYTDPVAAPYRVVMEAPWWTIVREITGESPTAQAEVDPAGGVLMAGAGGTPQATINFTVWTRQGAAAYTSTGTGELTPTGTLLSGVNQTATTLTLGAADRLANVAIDTWAVIDAGTAAEELVKVKALNLSAGTVTVARGVLDTTPHAHATNARIFFLEGDKFLGQTQYLSGESVDVKMATKTSLGSLATASAPTDTLAFAARAIRPYPPGNPKVNGTYYPSSATGNLSITWAHRDRMLQTAYILEQSEASIGPEAGTTYTVRVYNAQTGGTLIRTYSGITGTAQAYSTAMAAADNGGTQPANLRIELEAVRDGHTSLQAHSIAFTWA